MPKPVILIVEDEPELREMLAAYLEKEGFAAITAGDGNTGLQAALANRPDLMLVDLQMPGMTGYQMVTKVRESDSWGAGVPVIFLTNVVMHSREEQKDIAATGAEYIVKSEVDPEDVVKRIRAHLATRRVEG